MKPIRIITVASILGWFGSYIPVYAADTGADSAAGQKTFQGACAGCHQLKGYAGKSETELETAIKGIVAGTVKHPKKLTLSATDIANVATYISSNEPK
jgi:mono/diheme cytochrome c family protein